MTVLLYMDHHVQAAVTAGLRRRGIDVMTAYEDGTDRWDDERLLERANQLGRVLFTQDDDLLVIANLWLQSGRDFAGLVYSRQRGVRTGDVVRDLELVAQVMEPAGMQNQIIFIPFS